MLFLKIKALLLAFVSGFLGVPISGNVTDALTGSSLDKRVFDLVKEFGTSESPKSTRSSTTQLVPRTSWSPGVPPQHRKLVVATHRSPNMTRRHVRMLPWDPLWHLRHVGYPVSPRGYRRLPAFASLSMAGSGCKYKNPFYHNCCLRGTALDNKSPKL